MLIVSTSPGRPEYLLRTLDALEREAIPRHAFIVSDGPLDIDDIGRGWGLFELEGGGGRRRAGACALELALALDEDAVILEGDVVACRGGLHAMLEARVPDDVGLLSFFAPLPPPGFRQLNPGPPRITRVRADKWSYAQAIKIPRRMLPFVARPELLDVAAHLLPAGFDVALGELVAKTSTPFVGVVWPNVVDHIGIRSTLGRHLPHPRSPWCPGEDGIYPVNIGELA